MSQQAILENKSLENIDLSQYLLKKGDSMSGSLHLKYNYPLLEFNKQLAWGGSIGYENHINDSMDFSLTNSRSIFAFKTGHVFSQTENFLDNGTITPDFSIGNNGSPWAKVGTNIVWHTGNHKDTGPFEYIGSLTAGSSTVTKDLPYYGTYIVVANYDYWASAGGVWFVLTNPGDSRCVNIVKSDHASCSISGKTLSWYADSWGSSCHIYYL